ncbi:MAG TPA: DinB family protein [Anaerolineales bacterium]|nr:DinB family protein [Anaerolineales bacterium]
MEPEANDIVITYLQMMDQQREQLFADLDGLSEDALWQPPAVKEWSVGENLDHLRVINSSNLTLYKITWVLLLPLAKLRYDKPYQVDIDNVYKRPGFPLNTGWMWSPKRTPDKPTSLDALKSNLTKTHQKARKFYTGKDPDYLGHVSMYDPAIGWLNLIQALRVGFYHDELHVEQIQDVLQRLGNQETFQSE